MATAIDQIFPLGLGARVGSSLGREVVRPARPRRCLERLAATVIKPVALRAAVSGRYRRVLHPEFGGIARGRLRGIN